MADEGAGTCFEGVDGDHDESPADGIENCPSL
jgi:hypothetical protein